MAEVVGAGSHTHLILNLIGPDQPGLVAGVTRVIVTRAATWSPVGLPPWTATAAWR